MIFTEFGKVFIPLAGIFSNTDINFVNMLAFVLECCYKLSQFIFPYTHYTYCV